MFKLSKTTDYGIVLMAELASASVSDSESGSESQFDDLPQATRNARDLAAHSDLPVPMVSKILKALAREGLLISQRGSKGGYSLARDPKDLPVAEMIRVLEGPLALTDCAIGPSLCEHESGCAVREPWQQISRVVESALSGISLFDLVADRVKEKTMSAPLSAPLSASSSAANMSPTLQIDRSPRTPSHS